MNESIIVIESREKVDSLKKLISRFIYCIEHLFGRLIMNTFKHETAETSFESGRNLSSLLWIICMNVQFSIEKGKEIVRNSL